MSNSFLENSDNHHNTSSNPREEIVFIVRQSPETNHLEPYDDEAYATFEPSPPTYAQNRPLWIESLLTPWGLGSLLLILLANSLLSWAKWSDSYNTQTPTPPIASESAKINTPHHLSVEKSSTLSINSLSTAEPSSPSLKSSLPPQTQPQKVNIPPSLGLHVVTVKPKTDLKSALLPPSIQPKFIAVKTLPQPNSPTVLVKTPVPAPITPVAKPAVVQVPNSSPSSTIEPPSQRIIKGQTIEEMRPQEQKPPLPFIQKVKTQRQAIQSRQNLNQVLNNMEQQPQIQQPQQVQPQILQPLQPQIIFNAKEDSR
jgi:hypothetical protein